MECLYHIGQFHIYKISKSWFNRLKKKGIMNNHYLLVYSYVNEDNDIHVEEYTTEPIIFNNMRGFLISDNDITYSQTNLYRLYLKRQEEFVDIKEDDYMLARLKYLGNYFEKGDDIVLKFTPKYETSPNFIRSYIKKYSYEQFKYLIKDINFVNNCYEKFKEVNTKSPKNIEELIEYIKYNNPYEIFTIKIINEKSFHHEFDYNDMYVYYDIRHKNEIDIAHDIETLFINTNGAIVTIYNNVNDVVTKIEKECGRLNIKDYSIIYLEPNVKDKIQIKKITMNYKDLLKCNIEYNAFDYY